MILKGETEIKSKLHLSVKDLIATIQIETLK